MSFSVPNEDIFFEEAEPYLSQAAEIRLRRQGNSLTTAKNLYNLAETQNQIGQIDEAEKHYRQAFEIYAAIDGREDGEALKALCARYGFEGLYPLDNALPKQLAEPHEQAAWIYRANIGLIERATGKDYRDAGVPRQPAANYSSAKHLTFGCRGP